MQREIVSVMFMDVKGYSKLTEAQLRRFFETVLPELGEEMRLSQNR